MAVLNMPRSDSPSVLDSTVRAFAPKPRAAKPKREYGRKLVAWAGQHTAQIRNSVFAGIGFGSPVIAAFEWQSWAGWCALGLAALLFDKAVNGEPRERSR